MYDPNCKRPNCDPCIYCDSSFVLLFTPHPKLPIPSNHFGVFTKSVHIYLLVVPTAIWCSFLNLYLPISLKLINIFLPHVPKSSLYLFRVLMMWVIWLTDVFETAACSNGGFPLNQSWCASSHWLVCSRGFFTGNPSNRFLDPFPVLVGDDRVYGRCGC